jgi:hypothetical protein
VPARHLGARSLTICSHATTVTSAPGRRIVLKDDRHFYTAAEIEADLARPVVRALAALIRFRNSHPAFGGRLSVSGDPGELIMTWSNGGHQAELAADLAAGTGRVTWTQDGARQSAPLGGLPELEPRWFRERSWTRSALRTGACGARPGIVRL